MLRRIITIAIIAIVMLSSEVIVNAENDTPAGSEYADVPTTENEDNEYLQAKILVEMQIFHEECIKLLGCIIKLLVGLIVCTLLHAGAYVSNTVIKHMPEG